MGFRHALCFVALAAAVQLACASARAPGIAAMAGSASTPADHQRIAQYFKTQAAAARARGVEHRKLSALYGSLQNWGQPFAERQSGHCDQLTASQEDVAVQYELLAAEHDRLANE